MMFRLAIATGLSALVADARRMNAQVQVSTGTAPAGYEELSGKCTGRWIEVWADGRFAHYGEDHHIDSLDDCADMCDQHPECAGFYTKEGKCSHWRSGQVTARPQAGHMCYRKIGGGAPAPPAHHHHGGGGGVSASCDPVPGFNVQPGKCTGRWIEVWQDGHFAHYGEDHRISGLSDCASTCNDHNECSGFYTKNGRCSHWRSGSISVRPQSGHCCYTRDRSSLAQIEQEISDTLDMDDEEFELEMSNHTADMEDEDEEDLDAETGIPNCCWNGCCHGRNNRRNKVDRCWCEGSMCRRNRHRRNFCYNNFHYHHRMGRMGMGGVHVHYHYNR